MWKGLILVMFYKVSRFRCNDLSEMESLVEALALLPSVLCFPEYQCQAPCSLKNISLPFLEISQHWRNFEEQQHSILGICDSLSVQKTSLCSLIDRSWMRCVLFRAVQGIF